MKVMPIFSNMFTNPHKNNDYAGSNVVSINNATQPSFTRSWSKILPVDVFEKSSKQPRVIKTMKDFRQLSSHRRYSCIYCGKAVLPYPELDRMKERGMFSGSILDFSRDMFDFMDFLHDSEKEFLKRVVLMAFDEPSLRLSQAVKNMYPEALQNLLKEQLPILKEFKELTDNVPKGYKIKYKELLKVSKYKIEGTPYLEKFNGVDFNYKISRLSETIKDGVLATKIKQLVEPLTHPALTDANEPLKLKFVDKVLKLAEFNRLNRASVTKEDLQKLIVNQVKKYGELLNRKDIISLANTALDMLEGKPVVIKFSNKTFRKSLFDLFKDVHDEELNNKFLEIVAKLPTSGYSVNAFIVKHQNSASDAIGYDLLRPTRATIEHITAKSKGGPNEISNLAIACERDNSARSNGDLKIFIQKFPKENQENYFRNIFDAVRDGLISQSDAKGMIKTFFNESGRKINLGSK